MNVSKTRGIWSEEDKADSRFVEFNALIQGQAAKEGKVFFSWAGEGREIVTDAIDGEDMSGWLVPIEQADSFEKIWEVDRMSIPKEFADCFCMARWMTTDDGSIEIEFEL